MKDLTNALTVQEYVNERSYSKIWVCPHIVSNGKIAYDPVLKGIECTPSTIPPAIRDKKVWSKFADGSTLCVIWYNDTDVRTNYF